MDFKIDQDVFSKIGELFLSEFEASRITSDQGNVFEIKIENNLIGRVLDNDLQELISLYSDFPTDILVRRNESEEWVPLFDHPRFQRRQSAGPIEAQDISFDMDEEFMSGNVDGFDMGDDDSSLSLFDNEEKEEEQEYFDPSSIYFLIDGVKTGPFHADEVRYKLNNKEISYTINVSINDGKTWIHLYELKAFDRRIPASNANLPESPQNFIFSQSEDDAKILNWERSQRGEETSAMASLAYIGNVSQNKAQAAPVKLGEEASLDQIEIHPSDKKKKRPKRFQKVFYSSIFIISLAGLLAIYLTSPNNKKNILLAKEKSKQSKVGKAPASSDIQTQEEKNEQNITDKKILVWKKKLIEKAQQRAQGNDSVPKKTLPKIPRERQYDSGTEYEDDPVRDRVSKETYDDYDYDYDYDYPEENSDEDNNETKKKTSIKSRKKGISKKVSEDDYEDIEYQ